MYVCMYLISCCCIFVCVFFPRENLVYLQVGFKTMSYDLQEEQPAYDTNSLFGMLFYVITKVLSIFPTYNSRLGTSHPETIGEWVKQCLGSFGWTNHNKRLCTQMISGTTAPKTGLNSFFLQCLQGK